MKFDTTFYNVHGEIDGACLSLNNWSMDYLNNKAKGLLHISDAATCTFTDNTVTQTEFNENLILLMEQIQVI